MSKATFDGVTEKRKFIETYLQKIGWKLRHHGCDHWYFYNHKGRCTGLFLLFPETDARIEYEVTNSRGRRDGLPTLVFYLKDLCIDLLDDNCVSFSGRTDKSIFILLPNYDRGSAKSVPEDQKKRKIKGKTA